MSDLGNKKVFANNLNYYMNLNRVDRNKLCKDLNFNYTTVREWTNGTSYPRIDKIEMMANYFGIQKSDLIENRDNKKNEETIYTTTIYDDGEYSMEIKSDKPFETLSEEEKANLIQQAMDELYEYKRSLKKEEK